MLKKITFTLLVTAVLLAFPVIAQDGHIARIALMSVEPSLNAAESEQGLLAMLQADELLSAEEYATLMAEDEVAGERLSIVRLRSPIDIPTINLMVRTALERDPSVLITFSTMVTQIALNATETMDEPPVIIFSGVFNPFAAGIAQASCIKPDHVTGLQSVTPYDEILPIFLLQNPDLKTLGTIYDSSSAPGAYGVARIQESAAELGLSVEVSAITAFADLRPATQALLDGGVEALVLPYDNLVNSGLNIITSIASEYGVPVFHAVPLATNFGVVVGAGFDSSLDQGFSTGAILSAYLRGDLEIESTSIHAVSDLVVNVSQDAADLLGMDLNEELVEMSSSITQGGVSLQSQERLLQRLARFGVTPQMLMRMQEQVGRPGIGAEGAEPSFPLQAVLPILIRLLGSQEGKALYGSFIESLHCTPEMVAEQQAELDAAGG